VVWGTGGGFRVYPRSRDPFKNPTLFTEMENERNGASLRYKETRSSIRRTRKVFSTLNFRIRRALLTFGGKGFSDPANTA
jgi:hypothetical protein